ncbi:MFS transporter [Fervidicola ferrireducens]|nr:MFS transporter [Fervidicola ferrireducens]
MVKKMLLKNRNFMLFWVGQLISKLGDFSLNIALPFYVYHLTGSSVALAVTFISRALPFLLIGPIAGVFVDRWNLRITMLASDLLRAVSLVPICFVNSQDWVWIIWISSFFEASFGRFYDPAKQALIPSLVRKEELVKANGLSSLTESFTQILGPTIGGGIAAWLGFAPVVWIDIISYIVSAACILGIRLPTNNLAPKEQCRTIESIWSDLKEGIEIIVNTHMIRKVFITVTIYMISQGIINALLVIFIQGEFLRYAIDTWIHRSGPRIGDGYFGSCHWVDWITFC